MSPQRAVSSDEDKPFLDHNSDDGSSSSYYQVRSDQLAKPCSLSRTIKLLLWASIALNATFLLIGARSLASWPRQVNKEADVALSYSPANDIVSYHQKNIWDLSHAHMGKPGPEMEEAWSNDLEASLIRITDDELAQTGARYSIPLQGGGYAAGLGVSHNLHCLKRIKKYIYKDHYFPNVTEDKADEIRRHTEHCLEGLRQSVLCYADPSLLTVMWENSIHGNPGISSAPQHKCVNWEKMHEWMKSRAARQSDMFNPDLTTTYESTDKDEF